MEIRLVPDFYKEVKEESKSMKKYGDYIRVPHL